jgi:FkbM family methyltransferase
MIGKPRRNVIIPTEFGMMIVNRFDYNPIENFPGVGYHLMNMGSENMELMWILRHYLKDKKYPAVIDVGANIGAFSVQVADAILPANGTVYAFEPQRQIYQMLCGNLALNSVDNVYAEKTAVGSSTKPITVPKVDYYKPASFGSVGLTGEFDDVGQDLDFGNGEIVDQIVIDEYFKDIENISIIKVDVEGMELDVVNGAVATINKHRPLMYIEYYKQYNGATELKTLIESLGYKTFVLDINFICVPEEKLSSSEYEFILELENNGYRL